MSRKKSEWEWERGSVEKDKIFRIFLVLKIPSENQNFKQIRNSKGKFKLL